MLREKKHFAGSLLTEEHGTRYKFQSASLRFSFGRHVLGNKRGNTSIHLMQDVVDDVNHVVDDESNSHDHLCNDHTMIWGQVACRRGRASGARIRFYGGGRGRGISPRAHHDSNPTQILPIPGLMSLDMFKHAQLMFDSYTFRDSCK